MSDIERKKLFKKKSSDKRTKLKNISKNLDKPKIVKNFKKGISKEKVKELNGTEKTETMDPVLLEEFPYASKEELDDFLNVSQDDCDKNTECQNGEVDIQEKAYAVAMSEDDLRSVTSSDSDVILDNVDDDVDSDINSVADSGEDKKIRYKLREESRELAKKYKERNSRTIFVGNLTSKVTHKVLIQLFNSSKAAGPGAVESVRIRGATAPENSLSAREKKKAVILKKFADNEKQVLYAYVILKNVDDVPKCLALNGREVDGRHIRVDVIRGKKMTFQSTSCVFLGNLPYECNEEQIRELFHDCGKIVNVRLVRDQATGKGKGFGYVEFSDSLSISLALKLSQKATISDRLIRVQKWNSNETQQVKRKVCKQGATDQKPKRPIRIVVPTNKHNLEIKEYIASKKKKLEKKRQKQHVTKQKKKHLKSQ